jgi:peptide/nickel transport system substrate-binding protein
MGFNLPSQRRSIFDKYFHYIGKRPISDRLILMICFSVFFVSLLYVANLFNHSQKTLVATAGGTLTEGIVGTPRFANPVLAITRADQDVISLVYSGLMKIDETGELQPELAESVTISDDGLIYNIVLKENIYFHDDAKVTSADVAYTISLIQNPLLKSPLKGNWNDVEVEIIDEREFNLILDKPYTPFIENLTVGILPKHVWNELTIEQLPFSQHNTEPIGSGPYFLKSVDYNKSGLINSYTLEAFTRTDDVAKIPKIILYFYPNEEYLIEGFKAGDFATTASFPQSRLDEIDQSKYTIEEESLPRIFSVFINQNKSAVLRETSVRLALNEVIDKKDLVDTVLFGYGEVANSPIPPGFMSESTSTPSMVATGTVPDKIRKAEEILIKGGWEQQTDRSWQKEIDGQVTKLSVSLTTSNSPVFEQTASYLKTAWEKLGVEVSVAQFEQSDLIQVIIRPRDYELLLFGNEIGRQLDLYPFWHSSQKDDPGLNISAYTNITTDKLLETARTTRETSDRDLALREFEASIIDEQPAIFLYSPAFTYVFRNDITIKPINKLVRPGERFSQINSWYMSDNNVWKIFAN